MSALSSLFPTTIAPSYGVFPGATAAAEAIVGPPLDDYIDPYGAVVNTMPTLSDAKRTSVLHLGTSLSAFFWLSRSFLQRAVPMVYTDEIHFKWKVFKYSGRLMTLRSPYTRPTTVGSTSEVHMQDSEMLGICIFGDASFYSTPEGAYAYLLNVTMVIDSAHMSVARDKIRAILNSQFADRIFKAQVVTDEPTVADIIRAQASNFALIHKRNGYKNGAYIADGFHVTAGNLRNAFLNLVGSEPNTIIIPSSIEPSLALNKPGNADASVVGQAERNANMNQLYQTDRIHGMDIERCYPLKLEDRPTPLDLLDRKVMIGGVSYITTRCIDDSANEAYCKDHMAIEIMDMSEGGGTWKKITVKDGLINCGRFDMTTEDGPLTDTHQIIAAMYHPQANRLVDMFVTGNQNANVATGLAGRPVRYFGEMEPEFLPPAFINSFGLTAAYKLKKRVPDRMFDDIINGLALMKEIHEQIVPEATGTEILDILDSAFAGRTINGGPRITVAATNAQIVNRLVVNKFALLGHFMGFRAIRDQEPRLKAAVADVGPAASVVEWFESALDTIKNFLFAVQRLHEVCAEIFPKNMLLNEAYVPSVWRATTATANKVNAFGINLVDSIKSPIVRRTAGAAGVSANTPNFTDATVNALTGLAAGAHGAMRAGFATLLSSAYDNSVIASFLDASSGAQSIATFLAKWQQKVPYMDQLTRDLQAAYPGINSFGAFLTTLMEDVAGAYQVKRFGTQPVANTLRALKNVVTNVMFVENTFPTTAAGFKRLIEDGLSEASPILHAGAMANIGANVSAANIVATRNVITLYGVVANQETIDAWTTAMVTAGTGMTSTEIYDVNNSLALTDIGINSGQRVDEIRKAKMGVGNMYNTLKSNVLFDSTFHAYPGARVDPNRFVFDGLDASTVRAIESSSAASPFTYIDHVDGTLYYCTHMVAAWDNVNKKFAGNLAARIATSLFLTQPVCYASCNALNENDMRIPMDFTLNRSFIVYSGPCLIAMNGGPQTAICAIGNQFVDEGKDPSNHTIISTFGFTVCTPILDPNNILIAPDVAPNRYVSGENAEFLTRDDVSNGLHTKVFGRNNKDRSILCMALPWQSCIGRDGLRVANPMSITGTFGNILPQVFNVNIGSHEMHYPAAEYYREYYGLTRINMDLSAENMRGYIAAASQVNHVVMREEFRVHSDNPAVDLRVKSDGYWNDLTFSGCRAVRTGAPGNQGIPNQPNVAYVN